MPTSFTTGAALPSGAFRTYPQPQQQPNQGPAAPDLDEPDDTDEPASALDGEPLEEEEDDQEPPAAALEDAVVDLPPGKQDALRAERQKTNALEKELRTLRRQMSRFAEINPEEYAHLKEAEVKAEKLEQEMATRERTLERAASIRVRTVAKERDAATAQLESLRKDRLLERLFLDADGRQQGDGQRSFFDVFSQQVAGEFRLGKDAYDRDVLEPIDSKGNVLLGDDGPLTAQQHVEAMRTHPVLAFLFNQRGPAALVIPMGDLDQQGNPPNLQNMSATELFVQHYASKGANRSIPGRS